MAIFLTVASPEVGGYGSKKRREIGENQNKERGTRNKDHRLERKERKGVVSDKLENNDEYENEGEFFALQ